MIIKYTMQVLYLQMCFILKFMGQKCFVMKDEKKSEFLPIKKLYHRPRKDLKTLTDEIFNNMDTRQRSYIRNLPVRELRAFVKGLSFYYPEYKMLINAIQDVIKKNSNNLRKEDLYCFDQYQYQTKEDTDKNQPIKNEQSKIDRQQALTSAPELKMRIRGD